MGMSMHDRYYEPEDDDWDEIEEEIDDLLKNENNPYTEENIREAISEDALYEHAETLADLLSRGKKEEAGTVLSAILYDYWEKRTRNQVLDNL